MLPRIGVETRECVDDLARCEWTRQHYDAGLPCQFGYVVGRQPDHEQAVMLPAAQQPRRVQELAFGQVEARQIDHHCVLE